MSSRRILLCIENSDAAEFMCKWAVRNLIKSSDSVELVLVLRAHEPPIDILHGVPGESVQAADDRAALDKMHITAAKEFVKNRFTDILDERKLQHNLHMFVDSVNAPASAVCTIINRVADEVDATMVILASHNRTQSLLDKILVGSVAQHYVSTTCKRPVMIIPPGDLAALSGDAS